MILTSNFLKCYVTFITGISKGFGFLEFKSVSDAQEWMELHKVCQTKYLYTSVFANVHNCILVFISAENTVTNTRKNCQRSLLERRAWGRGAHHLERNLFKNEVGELIEISGFLCDSMVILSFFSLSGWCLICLN